MADIRSALHLVYSSIRSSESNKSISSITLDHLIHEHIETIEGGDSRLLLDAAGSVSDKKRISKLARLDDIQTSIDKIVAAVQEAGGDPEALSNLGLVPPSEAEGETTE